MHLFNGSNVGVLGIDLAEAIEINPLFLAATVLSRDTRQTSKRFGLVGIHQQDLSPVLRCQVDSAASLDAIPRHAPVEAPTPDAARSLAASLQSSWHRSRGDQPSAPPLPSRARRPDDGDTDDADTEEA